MFLDSGDGILCNFCGTIHKDQFVYYSVTARLIKIVNNMRISETDADFNKDMCQTCYDDIVEKIMNNIGAYKPQHIKDDFSMEYKSGTFNYWILYLDKVDVDKNRSEKVKVEKCVLDINLINYQNILDQTKKIEEKFKKSGAWS